MRLKDKFSKKNNPEKSSTKKITNEVTKELHEDKELVVGHAKRIKKLWKSKETVQLKTDAIAVLWKKKGHEEQFFEEFDKITKEGYQMVLTETVKAVDAGPLYVEMGSYYYFQHRNFIK